MTDVVIPLSKTGIALGSILVFTQVMGDYFVVRQMSGGQSASIVSMLSTEIQAMQYPPAAANAMVLVVFVAVHGGRHDADRRRAQGAGEMMVGGRPMRPISDKRPWTFYALATLFGAFLLFLYGPMFVIYVLSFQGPNGGVTFPMVGISLTWFQEIFEAGPDGEHSGGVRALASALAAVVSMPDRGLLGRRRARLPAALSRLRRRCSTSPSPAW